jgi:chromosome segregation ATPase
MQQAAAARLSAVESSLRGRDAPDDLLPELRSASGSRNSDGAADLVTIERQRRQLLEARLAAQMEANAALRRDNLELASHLTATSQQLRAALRSRDELRRQTAEAASVDKAIREAVSRRALQASQALCASLRARVSTLEEQVGAGAQSLRSRWTPQGAPPHTLLHTSIPLRKR